MRESPLLLIYLWDSLKVALVKVLKERTSGDLWFVMGKLASSFRTCKEKKYNKMS